MRVWGTVALETVPFFSATPTAEEGHSCRRSLLQPHSGALVVALAPCAGAHGDVAAHRSFKNACLFHFHFLLLIAFLSLIAYPGSRNFLLPQPSFPSVVSCSCALWICPLDEHLHHRRSGKHRILAPNCALIDSSRSWPRTDTFNLSTKRPVVSDIIGASAFQATVSRDGRLSSFGETCRSCQQCYSLLVCVRQSKVRHQRHGTTAKKLAISQFNTCASRISSLDI